MRFVAKSEVRRWPVIGWLCARAQTLFIERGKARSAARINVKLVELLQRGECLAIFPEGTTTDGKQVANFHSSLLQPAIDAGSLVHPIAIRYQDKYGAHNMASAYIDVLSFGASMWQILSEPELHVRLVATPSLDASGTERRVLTQAVHHHIGSTLAADACRSCFVARGGCGTRACPCACRRRTAFPVAVLRFEPSTLTLLGLVRHMSDVERGWFRRHAARQEVEFHYSSDEEPDADLLNVDRADASADLAHFVAECQLSRDATANLSLDEVVPSRGHYADRTRNVRWIYLHMIEEYARHNGHADLLRERIDGATGD